MLVLTDSIEDYDHAEFENQARSSWAQRFGLPSKSAAVMKHGVQVQNNEYADSQRLRGTDKGVTKVKTKGRFQVEIPTNGALNHTDTQWARKANPQAYKVQQARD